MFKNTTCFVLNACCKEVVCDKIVLCKSAESFCLVCLYRPPAVTGSNIYIVEYNVFI